MFYLVNKINLLFYTLHRFRAEEVEAALQQMKNEGSAAEGLFIHPAMHVLSQNHQATVNLALVVKMQSGDHKFTCYHAQNEKGEADTYQVNQSLCRYHKQLAAAGFVKCHTSWWVKVSFIERFEAKGELLLKDGCTVLLSDCNRRAVMQAHALHLLFTGGKNDDPAE